MLFAGAFSLFSNFSFPIVRTISPEKEVAAERSAGNASLLTRANFENVVRAMYDSIGLSDYRLDFDVFRKAMTGYYLLESEGSLKSRDFLTIIDFGKPSTEKRFYLIDLANRAIKFHTYVAHGRNTGENLAKSFSNVQHSNQSSLGFYVTAETYYGSKGYSLRLDGMEKSYNSNIRSRAVVVHGADYVSENWIKKYGRLGRSQGCPALPTDVNKKIIDTIKGGSVMFAHYPDDNYTTASHYVKPESLFSVLDERPVRVAGL